MVSKLFLLFCGYLSSVCMFWRFWIFLLAIFFSFFIFTLLYHNSENIHFNLLHITVFEWQLLRHFKSGVSFYFKCSAIKTFSGSTGSSIIATVADVFVFEGIFIILICFDLVLGRFSTCFSWTIKGRFPKWQICSCSASAYAAMAKIKKLK